MCACFSFLVVRIHKQPQDNRRSAHISVYMLWTIDVCLLFLPCRTDTLTVPGQPQVCSYICLHAVDSRCVLAFPSLSYRYTDSPRTTTGPFIYLFPCCGQEMCACVAFLVIEISMLEVDQLEGSCVTPGPKPCRDVKHRQHFWKAPIGIGKFFEKHPLALATCFEKHPLALATFLESTHENSQPFTYHL